MPDENDNEKPDRPDVGELFRRVKESGDPWQPQGWSQSS